MRRSKSDHFQQIRTWVSVVEWQRRWNSCLLPPFKVTKYYLKKKAICWHILSNLINSIVKINVGC